MKIFKLLIAIIGVSLVLFSCHEKIDNPNRHLELGDFSAMRNSQYAVNSHRIREQILHIVHSDSDSTMADFRVRSYYLRRHPFLWIDRLGVDHRADSLMVYLRKVDKMGFSLSKFYVPQIEDDLRHLRNLDFDSGHYNINKILARLEYHLTKSYLRYTTGQRFGFINPRFIFNRLDVHDSDSVRVTYRTLFDMNMELPNRHFYASAFRKIRNDSVDFFLHEVQPRNPLYYYLLNRLNRGYLSVSERAKLICNMERFRWRIGDDPEKYKKYVMVNIPSFRLLAVDGDSVLTMRIGCGSFDTKTPLLISSVFRMDVNPQWIIPHSIIDKDIIRHLGNKHYFDSHNFIIRERRTGKTVNIYRVSRSMLESRDYLVVQRGGIGNSLGRIIFRFDNDFSVFLHDTSTKEVFSRDDRGVSHGCVRVEKPFDLAVFMLKDKDRDLIDKIHYSMTADVGRVNNPEEGSKEEEITDTLDHSKLIGSINVEPRIPLFIVYYTMYPGKDGKMREYDDVYGYDRVIYDYFRNFR